MPTYGYRCPACGHEFDKFQKMTARPRATCPKCKAAAQRVISGGAGLVFKGSGFYITDYARKSDKADKTDRTDETGKTDKNDKTEKPDKADKGSSGKESS